MDKGYELRGDIGSVSGEVTDLFGRPIVVNVDLTARVDKGISGDGIDSDYELGQRRPGHELFTGEMEHVQHGLFRNMTD